MIIICTGNLNTTTLKDSAFSRDNHNYHRTFPLQYIGMTIDLSCQYQ